MSASVCCILTAGRRLIALSCGTAFLSGRCPLPAVSLPQLLLLHLVPFLTPPSSPALGSLGWLLALCLLTRDPCSSQSRDQGCVGSKSPRSDPAAGVHRAFVEGMSGAKRKGFGIPVCSPCSALCDPGQVMSVLCFFFLLEAQQVAGEVVVRPTETCDGKVLREPPRALLVSGPIRCQCDVFLVSEL